jgi:GH15 family glucan-1,4-alpha-glucosidase
MTNRDLFPGNIKKRMEYTETYNKLFKEFIDGEYKSIADFINKTGYDYSFQNIRMLWKRYIPDFNQLYMDCKGQATKPLTSKDAREWISR